MDSFLKERIKPKDWKDERVYYKQTKMNGHRMTIIKRGYKLKAYGRNEELSEKYPHIKDYEWWKQLSYVPNNSVVDGEVYVPGGVASDTTNQITLPDASLEFSPFAVPYWNNISLYPESLDSTNLILINKTDLSLTKFYRIDPKHDTREQMLSDAVDLGIEGWVLKRSNYLNWYKLKPVREIDCFVTGFTEGKGKYIGGVGALKVSIFLDGKLFEIARSSGMDDMIRWSIDEDEDLGRVCEIKYDSIGAKGRLYLPRFIRWRDDKKEDECCYKKDEL